MPKTLSSALFDLPGHGHSLGALGLFSGQNLVFQGNGRQNFEVVVQQIAMALDRLFLNLETQRLSVTDSLTGLLNRRQFQIHLEKEINTSRRYHQPVALIMLDLDHFKGINDTLGHPAGDMVLIELAGLLQAYAREADIIARYGGEEFAALLPKTDLTGARGFAERIRKAVETKTFVIEPGREVRCTLSVGAAAFPALGIESPLQLVEAADKALYEAKNSGRNRVAVAPNPITEKLA